MLERHGFMLAVMSAKSYDSKRKRISSEQPEMVSRVTLLTMEGGVSIDGKDSCAA